MHAEQLDLTPGFGEDDRIGTAAREAGGPPEEAPRLTATVLAVQGVRAEEDPGTPVAELAEARALIGRGRHREAATLLNRIIDEAQRLLDRISAAPALRPAALAYLSEARRRLKEGRYEEAVQCSHAAWRTQSDHSDDPEVFEEMIEIHCAAAMAGRFDDAERWLRCAYWHDRTNTRIRGLLADRTYRHAVELRRQGKRDDAVAALRKTIEWDPDHEDAQALLRQLGRRRRRDGGHHSAN
jgi:tetratricopeptide (TPR) repeat protein